MPQNYSLENFLQGKGFIQLIGLAAGILTSMSLMPQLVKTFKTKKAEEISFGMLITLMCGVSLWIYYGTLRSDLPINITNSFSLLLNIILLIFRIKYRSNK